VKKSETGSTLYVPLWRDKHIPAIDHRPPDATKKNAREGRAFCETSQVI